jgi:molybdopterin converting factor small subunit
MPINVLFFGSLTAITQVERVEFACTDTLDVEGLRLHFERMYPNLIGKPYRVAVNQEFAGEGAALRDGDEVAFLPPYAGG